MASLSPILVLQARAEARAVLLAAGEIASLDEAMNPLFDYAHQHGLVELVGADTVFAIINGPFKIFLFEEAVQ